MTNIFATPQDNEVSNPLEALVGEGRKYKSVEDLAKAQLAAQEHIQRLEAENGEFRTGLQRDILQREQQLQATTPPAQAPDQRQDQRNVPPQEDLAERIREVTRQDREAERTAANITDVTNRLTEVYGSDDAANKAVTARAAELGVSVKFLQDVAATSPAAFYAQMSLDAKPSPAPAPRGQLNTGALHNQNAGSAKPGTYKYYEEIRKTNPKLYNTPKIQLEMHKQAMENPAFFS